jgi:Na+/melibiose symporter-like transporter
MDILGWIVSILLIGISGGVVLLVMYFGTREQHHDESSSDKTHE